MINRYRSSLLISILLLAPSAVAFAADGDYELRNGKWVRTAAPAAGSPAGEVALIRLYVEDGKNAQAVKAAESFVKAYPDDPGCEEVMWLAGKAEMNRGRYYQAFEWFSKQIEKYPAGARSEPAFQREYQIGDAFLRGKKRVALGIFYLSAQEEGLDILLKISEQAPGTNLAERAMLRTGEYHFAKGEYPDAALAYDHYVELFKNSPNTQFAMLQAARATNLSFRGIPFDPTPLVDAEQRFRTFAQQYPETAKKENVPFVIDQIIQTRAEKDYATARFYERTGHPSGAAYYYRSLIDRYPATTWAAQAKIDLVRLGVPKPSPQMNEPAAQPRLAPPAPDSLQRPAPATQEGKKKP